MSSLGKDCGHSSVLAMEWPQSCFDIKCKHLYMFPKQHLVDKELNIIHINQSKFIISAKNVWL